MTEELEDLIEWSPPKFIRTKRGPKNLRTGYPTSEFWTLWKNYKDEIKSEGVSVRKNDDGVFELSWWQDPDGEDSPPTPAYEPPSNTVVEFKNDVHVTLPPDIEKILKPHQIAPTKTLCEGLTNHPFVLDASEMGMGKTFHALSAAKWLGWPVAVVCPASLKHKWEDTALQFFNILPTFVESYDKVRGGRFEYVTRKDGFSRGKKNAQYAWNLPETHLIIFEEVHACANPNTLNSELLKSALLAGHKVIGLSATVANSPITLKVLGQALGLHNGWGWWDWCLKNGCHQAFFGGLEFSKNKTVRVQVLNRVHNHIFPSRGVRARREALRHLLPDNLIQLEGVDVDSYKETPLLKKEIERFKEKCEEEEVEKDVQPITLDLRARQFEEFKKVPYLIQEVRDAIEEGFSVAVFMLFNDSINILADELKDLKPGIYTGKTPREDREDAHQAFQVGTSKLLILNLAAGSEGIDLHDTHGGKPRMAFICPTYSARMLLQALGRVDRVGKKSVSTQKLIFSDRGVEKKMMQVVNTKLDNLALLNDGDLNENFLKKIS